MAVAGARVSRIASRGRLRVDAVRGAHLLAVSGFALARPLFDLLGKNAEFFAVRGSTAGDIVLFALVVTFVPALVLLAIEVLVGLVSQTAATVLHHVFLGFLLIPPVLLKLASTGWRMLRYYRHADEYVRRGPPAVLLRVLVAPITVLATVVLFGSGVAVVALGRGGILLGVHKVSFIVWFAAMSVHVLAHVLELPRLIVVDWWRPDRLGGRRVRQRVLAGTLFAGLALAFMTLPLTDHWQDRVTAVVGFDAR